MVFCKALEKFPPGQFPPGNSPRSNSPRWITTWPNPPVVNFPPVGIHLVKFLNPNPGGNSPGGIWSGRIHREELTRGGFSGHRSVKKAFLKISQNSQENTCDSVSFLIKERVSFLSKKRLWHRCFPANFANFLRTPYLQNTSAQLLLNVIYRS